MDNRKKKILAPRWDNKEKTKIRCTFSFESGDTVTASVMETANGNPDWKQIFEEYKEEDIGDYVPGQKAKVHHAPRRREDPNLQQKDLNEILFTAKLEAFKIEEVKLSKNRALKSKIRKSKSLTEIYAYTAALVALEGDYSSDK